jgi:tetratricopeptide (TPR) repeat protein
MLLLVLPVGCGPADAEVQSEVRPFRYHVHLPAIASLANTHYKDGVFALEVSTENGDTLLMREDALRGPRQLTWLTAAFAVLLVGALTALAIRRRAKTRRLARAQGNVESLLSSNRPEDALKIIDTMNREILDRKTRDEWRGLEMDALEQMKDVEGLRDMVGRASRLFAKRESAALAVARAEVEEERFDAFASLRNVWRGREKTLDEWLSLDVDALLRQEKDLDAIDLLTMNRFEGAKDCGRAARYAFMKANESPERASTLLTKAIETDPRNPDVHLFCARYLETQGKPEEALQAYRVALNCAPHDPYLRDRLAEALRKSGAQMEALRIWVEGLAPPSMGFIWLKALFWTRVGLRLPISWDEWTPPRGYLRPLVDFIMKLDENRFWDVREFTPIGERQPELLSRQETFWLRVLEALRTRADGEALTLLNLQGFGARSWDPLLENALLRIVIYRLRGILSTSKGSTLDVPGSSKSGHPFFVELDEWTLRSGITPPEAAKRSLQSDHVFAAACFAAGWPEAGLRLLPSHDLPPDTPDWLKTAIEEATQRPAEASDVPRKA